MNKDIKELIEWLKIRKTESYETCLYNPEITKLINYIERLENMVEGQRDVNTSLFKKWLKRGTIISEAKRHLEKSVDDKWGIVDTSVVWKAVDILDGKYDKDENN